MNLDRLPRRTVWFAVLSLIPVVAIALSSSPTAEAPAAAPSTVEADDRIDEVERRIEALERSFDEMTRRQKKIAKVLGLDGRKTKSSFGRFARKLLGGGKDANEAAAISTLRNLVSAQAQLQVTAVIDANDNGCGEYGGFAELSGAVKGRMAEPLSPPFLSNAFRALTPAGEIVREGYVFRIYLVGKKGAAVGESQHGFTPKLGIDTEVAETTWCCYAWPTVNGKTGGRTFVINQMGDIVQTTDERHGGEGGGPKPGAAFVDGDVCKAIALDRRGHDGNTWTFLR